MWHANLQRNTRIGALRVKRGIITTEQLHQAVALQRERRASSLGDILVAQGWVSHRQLRSGLRRQARIRHVAALLAMLCAPLQLVSAGTTLPGASANAESVASAAASQYAQSPQLDLHDPHSRRNVREASAYKAAQLLSNMMLRSMWESMREDSANAAGSNLSEHAPRYGLQLSNNKLLVRIKYRF